MIDTHSNQILKDFKIRSDRYWSAIGEKETLRLFALASKKVPAYKDFLRKNNISPEKIRTISDFRAVPPVSKDNYLKVYPYEKLVWGGDIRRPITIHSTSGSTGEPSFFQRELEFDLRRSAVIENFFRYESLTLQGPTLFIITFGMGVWSAGMGIYTAAYLATNQNKFPISIISPGVNKIEILKILKKLAPNFKQVIIAGYPPLVKDIIDEAIQEKINLKKFHLRFIFTGEAFPEEFRDYLMQKSGVKNILVNTMNTYGTSEFGATAIETPLSIMIMRLARNKHLHTKLFSDLFGDIIKTPTLAQFIPYFVNYESINGELFFTGNNTIPLIRYQSGDHGGILEFRQVEKILDQNGISLNKENRRFGILKHLTKLPFVYVYERKNLAATFYGILIYPEFIKAALFDKQLSRFLSGKFTMKTKYTQNQDQYLEINLELKKGLKFKKLYEILSAKKIYRSLRERSSEFRELSDNLKKRASPRLVFWPYEHFEHFTPGVKQRWVKVDQN